MENRNSRKNNSKRPGPENKRATTGRFGKTTGKFNKTDSGKKPFKPSFDKRQAQQEGKEGFSGKNPHKREFKKNDFGQEKSGFKSHTRPKHGDEAPTKKPYRSEGKSFGNKSNSEDRAFGSKKEGTFERSPKRSTADKRTNIKSRFVSKSKSTKYGNNEDPKTPDYGKVFNKPTPNRNKRSSEEKSTGIRLNRYIANSGVCSRRDADLLISSGEITVNGNIVTEMGYIVQPTDTVKYSGRTLKREKLVYVLLNKPKDFITTTNDPEDRRTVMDLVSNAAKERLFPVGRLDRNTTGLLLLTNDGELAEKLSHPSNKIKKIYQVTLDRPLEEKDLEKIQKGVHLEDGLAEIDDVAILTKDRINLGLEIHIGRNRIVRRIFEALGYEVEKLDRVLYAELTKKDLPRGNWRYLTEQEVINLKNTRKG